VADAASVRNGPTAQQLRANLRRVAGPDTSEQRMDRLVGEALRSYARYWRETFLLESMDRDKVVDSFDRHFIGMDHYRAGLAGGKGMILALTHSGNYEASGIWLVHDSGSFTTVAERLKPESLFDRFVEYRQSLGMEVLPLTGGERPVATVLAERLRENKVVCLLADRDLSRNGIEVDFLGEPTRMPAGPALLAATTGASLHAVHSYFVGDEWGHTVSAPIALPEGRLRERVAAGTQAMADLFAGYIAGKPEDWHMVQKLWLADLDPRPEA
jgi:KDO2-lipid IV(A) lauroyltransferase